MTSDNISNKSLCEFPCKSQKNWNLALRMESNDQFCFENPLIFDLFKHWMDKLRNAMFQKLASYGQRYHEIN